MSDNMIMFSVPENWLQQRCHFSYREQWECGVREVHSCGRRSWWHSCLYFGGRWDFSFCFVPNWRTFCKRRLNNRLIYKCSAPYKTYLDNVSFFILTLDNMDRTSTFKNKSEMVFLLVRDYKKCLLTQI